MAGDTRAVRRFSEEEQRRQQAKKEEEERYKRALRLLLLTGTIRSAYEYAKRNGALLQLEELAFPEAEKMSSAIAMLALEALQYPATFGDINRKIGDAATPLSAASEQWDSFWSLRTGNRGFSRQRLMMEVMRDAEHNELCGSRMKFVSSVFLKCLHQTLGEEDLETEAHHRLHDAAYTFTGFMEWVKQHPLSNWYLIYGVVRLEAHDPTVCDRARELRDCLKKHLKA